MQLPPPSFQPRAAAPHAADPGGRQAGSAAPTVLPALRHASAAHSTGAGHKPLGAHACAAHRLVKRSLVSELGRVAGAGKRGPMPDRRFLTSLPSPDTTVGTYAPKGSSGCGGGNSNTGHIHISAFTRAAAAALQRLLNGGGPAGRRRGGGVGAAHNQKTKRRPHKKARRKKRRKAPAAAAAAAAAACGSGEVAALQAAVARRLDGRCGRQGGSAARLEVYRDALQRVIRHNAELAPLLSAVAEEYDRHLGVLQSEAVLLRRAAAEGDGGGGGLPPLSLPPQSRGVVAAGAAAAARPRAPETTDRGCNPLPSSSPSRRRTCLGDVVAMAGGRGAAAAGAAAAEESASPRRWAKKGGVGGGGEESEEEEGGAGYADSSGDESDSSTVCELQERIEELQRLASVFLEGLRGKDEEVAKLHALLLEAAQHAGSLEEAEAVLESVCRSDAEGDGGDAGGGGGPAHVCRLRREAESMRAKWLQSEQTALQLQSQLAYAQAEAESYKKELVRKGERGPILSSVDVVPDVVPQ